MTWTGARRPKPGQKPRRLEHPEWAHWLHFPDGGLQGTSARFSQDVIDEYNAAWDAFELRERHAKQLEFARKLEQEEESRRRHEALEEARFAASKTQRRVLEKLGQVPGWWGEWWNKLEEWMDEHPPKTYVGPVGDTERLIGRDAFESAPEFAPKPKRGWPKGRKHSYESRMRISETRRAREAAGTWGHRTPDPRKPSGPDWEQDEIERLRAERRERGS